MAMNSLTKKNKNLEIFKSLYFTAKELNCKNLNKKIK